MSARPQSRKAATLEWLALHRPELRAWALYDWANSAAITTVVTAVFPIYFRDVVAADLPAEEATRHFAALTAVSLLFVALLSPVLGALADLSAAKKRLLAGFVALGCAGVAALFSVGRGDLASASLFFFIANVGVTGSFVFYNALLPHVARRSELDRLATSGYALGYLGGGVLLAVNLLWIQRPELFGLPSGEGLTPDQATLPTRLAFLSVALWWAGFSIPLFRHVREPAVVGGGRSLTLGGLSESLSRLGQTLRALRRHRNAGLMLLAFLAYNDGILTIIRMATTYGAEQDIDRGVLIGAILMVQFVGIPFSLLFGVLARRFGARRSILGAIGVYVVVAFQAYGLETARDFWLLAFAVGTVQGGCQALSKSLFASMVPRDRSAEFFGFFGVMERAASVLGPGAFYVAHRVLGSSRLAIGSMLLFFVVGAVLLMRVDVEEGRRAAGS